MLYFVKNWILHYIVQHDVIVFVNCYDVLVNGNHDNYRWEGYKQWREDWLISVSTLTDLTLYDVITGCHRNN